MNRKEGRTTTPRSRILVGLVACWLLVGLAVGGASGVAAAGYEDTGDACASDAASSEFSLLLLLENGDVYGPEDTAELYPGTEARIVYCSDTTIQPTGSAWSLTDTNRVIEEGSTDNYYTVTTGNVETDADLTSVLDEDNREEADGPTLRIVTAQESTLSYLEDPVTIRFAGGTGAAPGPVEQELAAYNQSLTTVQETRSELATAANASSPTSAEINASALIETRSRFTETGETLSLALFASAQNGTPGAADGFLAHEAHHERAIEEYNASIETYLAAAEGEARTARLTAIGALLGSFVLFGGVGGGVGQWLSTRDLQSIRRERRRRSSVGYSWSDLKKALAIASLGVIVGVVSSILLGTTLLEVLA